MIDILDNNEWANLIWLILIVCFLLAYKPTRFHLRKIFKVVFDYKILIIYAAALIYDAFWIKLLYDVGFWEFSLLKETILWMVLVGSVMIYDIVKVDNTKLYFIGILNDVFKWAMAIEFITGLYSFNFYFEFFFIPISLFIGGIIAVNEKDEKNGFFINKLKNIIVFVGFVFLIYKLAQIISDYKSYLNIDNLKQFMLTPILAALFIPFLYGFFLYVKYENVFLSIKYGIKSPELRRYAKFLTLWKFNFDIDELRRWRDSIFMNEVHSKSDVKESIKKIKRLQKIEKNPPEVDFKDGWSPYLAMDYLKVEGLRMGHYSDFGNNEWSSASNYFKLDDCILANNIAYYINGNENIVNSLKLVLNINNTILRNDAHSIFQSNIKSLYKEALGEPLPSILEASILEENDFYSKSDFIEIFLKRENWDNGNGYHVIFEIKHNFVD